MSDTQPVCAHVRWEADIVSCSLCQASPPTQRTPAQIAGTTLEIERAVVYVMALCQTVIDGQVWPFPQEDFVRRVHDVLRKGMDEHKAALRSQQSVPPEAQALVERLDEEAESLQDAVDTHLVANAEWIRDNGKRSVTIVEYQLNKKDLGSEARLLKDVRDFIVRQAARIQELEPQNEQMRATLIAIEPRCEYVGCEKPGPHVTHSISGTATAALTQREGQ